MTRSLPILAALASATLPGASAARIFAGYGPRIALEAPDMAGLAQRFDTHAGEVKTLLTSAGDKIGSVEEKMAATDSRLSEIEMRLARPRGPGASTGQKSLGETFVESEHFKSLAGSDRKRGQARIEIESKAILSNSSSWGNGASVTNSLVVADRRPMVELPRRALVLRDLLTVSPTTSNAVEYPVQTGFTNAAAVVAEAATKPYSNITTDLVSRPVRTIAHMMKASRQIMDDAPALRSFIDSQMTYGLQVVEEAEVLYGDGTGQHLLGIVPQASTYSAPFVVADETGIDRIALALLQSELALLPSSGILIHPTDWRRMQMIKDGMGRYLIGDPQGSTFKNLWDVPVATSLAVTAGTFVVGAFRDAATLFERLSVEVLLSTENADDFEKNLVSIRVEERVALAVFRPAAFITGSLPA